MVKCLGRSKHHYRDYQRSTWNSHLIPDPIDRISGSCRFNIPSASNLHNWIRDQLLFNLKKSTYPTDPRSIDMYLYGLTCHNGSGISREGVTVHSQPYPTDPRSLDRIRFKRPHHQGSGISSLRSKLGVLMFTTL